ncbi:MAG: pseudouridine synthase [Crocinitomicaceae bacterium]|nr:pseudouridine synthase [Crocinitomicaceae bacterium]MDG1657245.1 pseudouridine synthase [Crocinitomicaceae bacterium]
MELLILYEDPHLVAIHKPNGLLVHRTKLAADATEFALQLLRDQLGIKVYPTHRLDRKTSGILLFAKDEDSNREMQKLFMEQKVEKEYLAIVRGWIDDKLTLDYPLYNEAGKKQDAITTILPIEQVEIDLPFGKFSTSRYTCTKVKPETGRIHQIRKHFAHLRHPIVGDRPHGCNKQNKLFKEHFFMTKLMLHASSLSFVHPISLEQVVINSQYCDEFERMIDELGFTTPLI